MKCRLNRLDRPRNAQWDTRVQTPDESRRMAAYVRFAERAGFSGHCATCAFRPGTEANRSAKVLDMIEQQALAGNSEGFRCHAGGTMLAGGFMVNPLVDRVCPGFAAFMRGPSLTPEAPHDDP